MHVNLSGSSNVGSLEEGLQGAWGWVSMCLSGTGENLYKSVIWGA